MVPVEIEPEMRRASAADGNCPQRADPAEVVFRPEALFLLGSPSWVPDHPTLLYANSLLCFLDFPQQ